MKSRRLSSWVVDGTVALLIAAGLLFVVTETETSKSLNAQSSGPIRVLSLTKSAGYEHSVIHREAGKLGMAEEILLDLAAKNNLQIAITKDAGMINAKQLAQFDVVHFYTTGELTDVGNDKNPPMAADGPAALIEFVKNGGGFVGTHTTTDTFHKWEADGDFPYLSMVGGEFRWHGKQQAAELNVQNHPTTAHLGSKWDLTDEYYQFQRLTNKFQPLLIVNTKSMEEEGYKTVDPYPITWVQDMGEGRVFNTSLGHREDVWTNPKYQELVVRGIQWAAKKL